MKSTSVKTLSELVAEFEHSMSWLDRQKIPLRRVRDATKAHLWLSDFLKFAEQFGDTIGWDATNRKYVLAHAMTGVDWDRYKHPLPKTCMTTGTSDTGEMVTSRFEQIC